MSNPDIIPAHEHYMARALQLAERGLYTTDPNPRVGCVIVKHNQIVGEGWHQYAGQGHAEINALRDAGEKARDADCYVTLEPCSHFGRTPPCAEALITSGIRHVFIAMADPNPLVAGQGIERLKAAGIAVSVGILQQDAEDLNPGFCQRMRIGRPYVRSKIAMSIDGRTAMASGESQWITGIAARQDVQKLRARSSAIVTGIGTVLADNPSLTVRPEGDWYPKDVSVRQPLRVVVDSHLAINKNAKILDDAQHVLIATTQLDRAGEAIKMPILSLPADNGHVDLTALMAALAQREINEVMIEAGAILNGALLRAGLIDEIVVYMAPKILGDHARGLFNMPELHTMADTIELAIVDMRAIGNDWRITAKPHYKEDRR